MEDARIGRRYAQALFSIAQQHNLVQSIEDDLAVISRLVTSDAEFRGFWLVPTTGPEEKLAIAEKVFADRVTALTMQVLRVVLAKGREGEIPAIHREFGELRRAADGVTLVTVSSSVELTSDERSALTTQLSKKLNSKVEAEYVVEPRLIGGIRVAYNSNVLDGSVKGALARLRERLRYDLLKQA